jgi:hypothetical protein
MPDRYEVKIPIFAIDKILIGASLVAEFYHKLTNEHVHEELAFKLTMEFNELYWISELGIDISGRVNNESH